ncbi:hypothetical protein IEQ34_019020 [Dendrobium chrysotoxum]|uniref:Serine hydroxymethyltransferase-like domain-containing protein n=1 Tax=Dendrobium chrysotoxum TaxID=161865 RepID=A0AAV7G5Q7_DENCH|nr:hypothetical protein IEQ34_019020 [Dendrobium chrysotoxum]
MVAEISSDKSLASVKSSALDVKEKLKQNLPSPSTLLALLTQTSLLRAFSDLPAYKSIPQTLFPHPSSVAGGFRGWKKRGGVQHTRSSYEISSGSEKIPHLPALFHTLVHPRALIEPDLETRTAIVRSWGNNPLHVADPAVHEITEKERHRQIKGIELIASANYVCQAVLDALGSHLTDRYFEGMSGARYYAGNQYSDEIEGLCCERALAAFSLDPEYCGVNLPPYSSTSANFAVYTGLFLLKGSLSGGHVSHEYLTPSGKRLSGASSSFKSLPYKLNPKTGLIDFDQAYERAIDFHPKTLICGASPYPRDREYAKFGLIAEN